VLTGAHGGDGGGGGERVEGVGERGDARARVSGGRGVCGFAPLHLRREAKSGWARWEETGRGRGRANLRIGPCTNKYITGSPLCSCARYSTRSLPFRSGWEFSFSLLLVSSFLFVRVY
jgi:hypothetical protein